MQKQSTPELDEKVYVNKIIYGFLCLFFGMLGIHEFYARRKETGYFCLGISLIINLGPFIAILFFSSNEILTNNIWAMIVSLWISMLIIYILFLMVKAIKVLCKKPNEDGKVLV